MLTHHEPSTTGVDFASLSHEQRSQIIQRVMRRAHIERAKAVREIAGRTFHAIAFWRHGPPRAAEGQRHGTPPNCARAA